jgi:hypothetical protein
MTLPKPVKIGENGATGKAAIIENAGSDSKASKPRHDSQQTSMIKLTSLNVMRGQQHVNDERV